MDYAGASNDDARFFARLLARVRPLTRASPSGGEVSFGTVGLGAGDWLRCIVIASLGIVAAENRKAVRAAASLTRWRTT